jgi:hypothetical protein
MIFAVIVVCVAVVFICAGVALSVSRRDER